MKPACAALLHNNRVRRLCLAIVGCAFCGGASLADGGAPAARAAWAIGLPGGYAILEHQVRSIEVTPADVAKGMVEVRSGSRLVIVAEAPGAYAVDFHLLGDWVRTVWVLGIGSRLEFEGRAATSEPRPLVRGQHTVVMDYQFRLAPGVIPGSYAWPLQMTVHP